MIRKAHGIDKLQDCCYKQNSLHSIMKYLGEYKPSSMVQKTKGAKEKTQLTIRLTVGICLYIRSNRSITKGISPDHSSSLYSKCDTPTIQCDCHFLK